MPVTNGKTWRAGRFGCDNAVPSSTLRSLSAIVFDLDALTDIECDGHRIAYNAAFASHDLDFQWSPTRYRQLLALGDERQRVSAELRKRGVATESDVLTQLLADDICATKTMMFDELIADADLALRPGLADLLTEAAIAGVCVGVVTTGRHSWAEPLLRRLVGDAMGTLVAADDVKKQMPNREAFEQALAGLTVPDHAAMAIVGSAWGLRAATAQGLATIVVTGDGTPKFPAAVAVRADYGGADPLGIADCQRLHDWWLSHVGPAAVA